MEFTHGSQLMNALFGGAIEPTSDRSSGSEKRLEFDLRCTSEYRELSGPLLRDIADVLEASPIKLVEGLGGNLALQCDKAVIVATRTQLVMICDVEVDLHKCVEALRRLVENAGFSVEWASYLRKNTLCPWDTKDVTMAHEYATLKQVFPSGKPFIFGAVDSDHYFYFVYDDIVRGIDVIESDVQINVKLYNVEDVEAVAMDSKSDVSRVEFAAGDQYSVTRCKRFDLGNVVTFESNYDVKGTLERMVTKIREAKPERFTLMVLLDPHCSEIKQVRARERLGFESESYPDYSLVNRTTNTFEHGYTVIKQSYVKL